VLLRPLPVLGAATAVVVGLVTAAVGAPAGRLSHRAAVRSATASAASSARPVGRFLVGAATVTINPTQTTYAGGFGASPPIRPGHVVGDPLSVRALYISNGHRAVELAVVDSQAEFAAYQEGASYGLTAARTVAAAAIDARHRGPSMTPADIIIQSTHSHSAPTLEGLWGPVPVSYLRAVTRAEETALERAAARARSAELQVGTANAASLDDVEVAQYDAFPGWADDPLLTVLRAVDPATKATIATYATVPAHPDIVCGSCQGIETADYQGIVRADLQRQLGGIALVGPATLGREETPVQATSVANDHVFATQVRTLVDGAISHAQPLRSNTLAAAQQFVQIPGTGAALLGLVEANHLPAAEKQSMLATTGEYPIDRADTPPYQTGSVIGTWTTALRVGDVAYLSMPGEPFPEIRQSLAAATHGALVVALSKGQDDLGYFYPSYVTPLAEAYPSDTATNSASAETGDIVMAAQDANLRALGFDTRAALPKPVAVDPGQTVRPGLQVVGGPFVGDAGHGGRRTVRLLATFSPPDLPEGTLDYGLPAGSVPVDYAPRGTVHWTFGDGSTGVGGYHEFAGTDLAPVTIAHRYRPGTYHLHATITDATGRPVTTSLTVTVHRALRVRIVTRHVGRATILRPRISGGDGHGLAVRWTLPGGRTATGPTVRTHATAGRVSVAVTDGTGTVATARTRLPLRRG
jgi:hypothetical protein